MLSYWMLWIKLIIEYCLSCWITYILQNDTQSIQYQITIPLFYNVTTPYCRIRGYFRYSNCPWTRLKAYGGSDVVHPLILNIDTYFISQPRYRRGKRPVSVSNRKLCVARSVLYALEMRDLLLVPSIEPFCFWRLTSWPVSKQNAPSVSLNYY